MTKGKRIIQIIGTVVFCLSSLYFLLLNLSESVDFVYNILYKSCGWFDTGNDSILGYLCYTTIACIVGFILLAIAYRKDKKFLPLISILALVPLSIYNVHGKLIALCIIYALLIAACIAYAIWLAVKTGKRENA